MSVQASGMKVFVGRPGTISSGQSRSTKRWLLVALSPATRSSPQCGALLPLSSASPCPVPPVGITLRMPDSVLSAWVSPLWKFFLV